MTLHVRYNPLMHIGPLIQGVKARLSSQNGHSNLLLVLEESDQKGDLLFR